MKTCTETTASITAAAPYQRALDKLEASVVTAVEPVSTCPRCTGTSIAALGDVHSSVEWFHCRGCDHVWAIKVAIAAPVFSVASRVRLLRFIPRVQACVAWVFVLFAMLGRRATGV